MWCLANGKWQIDDMSELARPERPGCGRAVAGLWQTGGHVPWVPCLSWAVHVLQGQLNHLCRRLTVPNHNVWIIEGVLLAWTPITCWADPSGVTKKSSQIGLFQQESLFIEVKHRNGNSPSLSLWCWEPLGVPGIMVSSCWCWMLSLPPPISLACTQHKYGFSYFLDGRPPLFPRHSATRQEVLIASICPQSWEPACSFLWARLGAVSPSGPSASWLLVLQFGFLFSVKFPEFTFELTTQPLLLPFTESIFFSRVPADLCSFLARGALSSGGHFKTPLQRTVLSPSCLGLQPRSSLLEGVLLSHLEKIVATFWNALLRLLPLWWRVKFAVWQPGFPA